VGMGTLSVANEGDELTTFLGSCIAIIMIGENQCGLAHCILPTREKAKLNGSYSKSAKYIDEAIIMLEKRITAHTKKKIQTHVYGGASILNMKQKIGHVNSQFVIDELRNKGFRIYNSDLGGNNARFIKLDCTTKIITCDIIDNPRKEDYDEFK